MLAMLYLFGACLYKFYDSLLSTSIVMRETPTIPRDCEIDSRLSTSITRSETPSITRECTPEPRIEDLILEDDLIITPEVFASIPDRREELCPKCAALDFDQTMQLEPTNGEGIHFQDLGDIEDLLSSSCPLCCFWAHTSPRLREEQESTDPIKRARTARNWRYLRVFDFNERFVGLEPEALEKLEGQATLLGVVDKPASLQHLSDAGDWESFYKMCGPVSYTLVATGYICLTNIKHQLRTMSTRLINSEHADLSFVRHRLNYCHENHGITCGEKTHSAGALKVIDCVTRKVVEAPNACKYVALSYVRGQSSLQYPHEFQTPDKCLPQLPKTIEDSIIVTKELGLRYLWVDIYCMDQSGGHKLHQAHPIDLICSGAELTIIDAAGDDPSHGLSGINGTPRRPQRSIRIGDHLMTETLSCPRWSVKVSKWATRAWTYQEGIFSRRRLIFTSDQVLYECESMNCAESQEVPLYAVHTTDSIPFKRPGTTPEDIWNFIQDYSQRDMSDRGDKFNAIQNILRCFEEAETPVLNLSGAPIFNPIQHQLDISGSMLFLSYLLWEIKEDGERLPEFPSWSWIGWHGGYVLHVPSGLSQFGQPHLDHPTLWIESVTGDFEIFPDDIASPSQWASINMRARFLEIEAWTISCSLVYTEPQGLPEFGTRIFPLGTYVKFPLNDEDYGYGWITLSSAEDRRKLELGSLDKSCIGIIIPLRYKGGRSDNISIMIVADRGDFWERMGHFRISRRDFNSWLTHEKRYIGSNFAERWYHSAPKTKRRIRLG